MRRGFLIAGLCLAAHAAPLLGQSECGSFGEAGIHACIRTGDGPTIVLAAGAGQDSRTWTPLLDDLAALGTVVSFDRPGLGRSPGVDGDRTPTAIARELRHVLTSLGVADPVLLVGHSMGGIHALRYSELFPESVVGVVLLDTPPPGFEEARMTLLSPVEREERQATLSEGRSRAPEIVGRERDGAAAETWEFNGFPSTRPLAVVVADSQYFGELGSEAEHRALWMRLSRGWLELSSRSELVVATGSGHMVHRERPGLVLDVVRRLIDRSGPPSP